ncbi:MAG: hypothetical protein VX259_07785, partial [Pseudomonadota bacterium]|nr:hypothetical protein [Pseudomonadota bacterium]
AERCTQTDSGARSIDHLLTSSLMPALAEEVLGAMADDQPIDDLVVGVDDQQRFTYRKASSSAACQEEVDVESVG